ncbi:MAG: type II toxin-antitoxin system HicA family toxin [Oscillospiraceae bacterium]|nr:type II toxin-antitoxin system HicA family toxin [Oscillospiraceae bacterium]
MPIAKKGYHKVADYDKNVRDILLQNGCRLTRHGKGSHEIWYSSIADRSVTVSKKIKSRHTANKIMKEAGVDHKF